MAQADILEQLAAHMDKHLIGAPMTDTFRSILEILYPGEEAELALRLPLVETAESQIRASLPQYRDRLDDLLQSMVRRGTVFTLQEPGKERTYRLFPTMAGISETPFWGGGDTPELRKLAPLWLKYRQEAFAAEVAKGVPLMRVIPIGRSLKNNIEYLPYDALAPRVDAQEFAAVANCACRRVKRLAGSDEACEHSTEVCLHFGRLGMYMVQRGIARQIDNGEALAILKKSAEDGLVHAVENMEDHLGTVCNCCGCCCVMLDNQKKLGLHLMSRSNYVSVVDAGECISCGVCAQRCPMDAVTVPDGGPAIVNQEKCIGCGVCASTCAGEAIGLVLRAQVEPPPKAKDFYMTRMAAKK